MPTDFKCKLYIKTTLIKTHGRKKGCKKTFYSPLYFTDKRTLFIRNRAARFHRVRKPHVAADNAVIADFCIAAEDCCVGIDNNIVSYVGVAFNIFYGVAAGVGLKALCAERYALLNFHHVA